MTTTTPARPLSEWTDDELAYAAEDCTEHSCIWHGSFNREMHARRVLRERMASL